VEPLNHADAGPFETPAMPRAGWALLALVLGFILARGGVPVVPSGWFAAALALCALAGAWRSRFAGMALFLAMLCFGAAWFGIRLAPPGGPWQSLSQESTPLIEVQGTLLDTPRAQAPVRSPLVPHATPGWSATIAVDSLVGASGESVAQGTLLARGEGVIEGALATCRAGDRVRVTGKFRAPRPPNNPGERDRVLLGRQEGRVGTLAAGRAETVTLAPSRSGLAGVRAWFLRTRATLARRAEMLLLPDIETPGTESRALLHALVLGDEPGSRDLDDVRTAFAHTGLAHILSISGFHLVVMVWIALLALRLAGDLGAWESWLVAGLLSLYLVILPFDAPIWRSAIMVLALLLSEACGRRYERLSILCWVAVALLLYRPLDAWSMGFQLSFGLVGMLIRLGMPFHRKLWGERLRGVTTRSALSMPMWVSGRLEALKTLISTNILCSIASMPIIAFHTGTVSPLAPLIGVVAVPLVSLLFALCYFTLLVGAIVPSVSGPASVVLACLASAVAWFVRWCDALPGAWFTLPRLSIVWCIAASIVLLWLLARWRSRRHAHWAILCVLIAWTCAEIVLESRLPPADVLRLDTLAVGDGTCHLVRSGGDALLWDAGSLEGGLSLGNLVAPRALREADAWKVRTAVVTHPNLDHYNALPGLAETIGLRELLVSPLFLSRAESHPQGGEAFTLAALRAKGVRVRAITAGATMKLGECEVMFLSPPDGMTEAEWPHDNDHCLVARFDRAASNIGNSASVATALLLLVGDIEAPAIERIEQSNPELHARVMEAPHHGSAKQAAMRWMQQVHPGVVVQSTGPKRARDPRWDGVRSALGAHSSWWCTAIDGAISIEWRRDGTIVSKPFHAPSDAPVRDRVPHDERDEDSAGSDPRP
jgi:competence protein ComEC